MPQLTEDELTEEVVHRLRATADPRLREVMIPWSGT
jgi:hypothetical protein